MRAFTALLMLAGTLAAATPDPVAAAARLVQAREQISRNPAQPDGHIAMVLALIKASRASGQKSYLAQAEKQAEEVLRVSPDNFEAQKAHVALRLAQRRYPEALAEAEALNKKVPDDNQMYGFLADAQIALGNYPAAEKATQWMIDQRPVNSQGLQRGALVRELFGYNEPALEWWNSALRITSSSDTEDRAFILVNMSRVRLRLGKASDAEKDSRQALQLVPDYPWAYDSLAAALSEQGKSGEAATILAKRLDIAPDVAARFHLAQSLESAGKTEEARAAWQRFETEAESQMEQPGHANPQLIEYYATHGKAAAGVRLGAAEIQRRPNIATLAAYAGALSATGKDEEARQQIEKALAPGIRDAKLFLQAGAIAARLHNKAAASKYLRQTIEINASSPEADKAIRLLANLS